MEEAQDARQSEQPAMTFLAQYQRDHGSTAVWLATQLGTSRRHVSHLIDPTDPNYVRYVISNELMTRLARFLKKRRADVVANYESVRSAGADSAAIESGGKLRKRRSAA